MKEVTPDGPQARQVRRERRRPAQSPGGEASGEYNSGRWTAAEHYRFLEALKLFGKEWQKVQRHVASRTSTQARSHAQKFFGKLEKRSIRFDVFIRDLDLAKLKASLGAKENSTDYDEEEAISAAIRSDQPPSVMNLALPKKKAASAGAKRQREPASEETSPSQHKRAKVSETSEQAAVPEELPKPTLSYSEIVKPFSALSVEQRTNVSAEDDYSFTVDFY